MGLVVTTLNVTIVTTILVYYAYDRQIQEFVLLVYVDSLAVNAVKHGRILILEGIDKAERGIMPVLECPCLSQLPPNA
jgi:hypothetical protein